MIKFTWTDFSLHLWVWGLLVFQNHLYQRKPLAPLTGHKLETWMPPVRAVNPNTSGCWTFLSGVQLQPSVGSWTQSITADLKTRSAPWKAAAAGSHRPPLCWGGGSCVLGECVAAVIRLQPLSSSKINTQLIYGVHSIMQIPLIPIGTDLCRFAVILAIFK